MLVFGFDFAFGLLKQVGHMCPRCHVQLFGNPFQRDGCFIWLTYHAGIFNAQRAGHEQTLTNRPFSVNTPGDPGVTESAAQVSQRHRRDIFVEPELRVAKAP